MAHDLDYNEPNPIHVRATDAEGFWFVRYIACRRYTEKDVDCANRRRNWLPKLFNR